MKKIGFLLLIISCLFSACRRNKDIGATSGVYDVDPEFESYVQDFIAEGAKRGQTIDFSDSGLLVELSDGVVGGASGFCYVGEHHVVIDKSEWFSLSEDVRGFLLFHELGHCELDRGHRNEKFSNSLWKSIMRGSPPSLEVIETFIPIPYYGFRKDYYIDELFNENMAAPTWAEQTFSYGEVAETDKQLIVEDTASNRINRRFSEDMEEYEIEIDFNLIKDRGNITELQWGTTNHHYYIRIIPEIGFNVDGYFIGVHQNSKDKNLFYSKNTININGEELHKLTMRREGGFEKIFINDEFIFHIDPLPNPLELVRFEAATNDGTIDNELEVNSLKVSKIK